MGGPRYQPGYYRGVKTGGPVFVMRTPGAKGVSEKKYFDTEVSAIAVPESTNWTATEVDPTTLNTLVCPVQGAQINNRIGRKILLRKLRIRGVLSPVITSDSADVLRPRSTRIIVYQDKQTNGAQAQGEDVMKSPTAATTPMAFNSFMSLANLGRFVIWKDKTYSDRNALSGTDGANTNSVVQGGDIPFKMNFNFKKPIVVHFNSSNGGAGDGDVGDIVDNSFHVLVQSSNSGGSATISYACRAVYTDE